MVTDGKTLTDAIIYTEDAIATMISDTNYPGVQGPTKWQLGEHDSIRWVTVNIAKWLEQSN